MKWNKSLSELIKKHKQTGFLHLKTHLGGIKFTHLKKKKLKLKRGQTKIVINVYTMKKSTFPT